MKIEAWLLLAPIDMVTGTLGPRAIPGAQQLAVTNLTGHAMSYSSARAPDEQDAGFEGATELV